MDMIICYAIIHDIGCFGSEVQVSRVEANDTVDYIFIKESIFYIMHLYTIWILFLSKAYARGTTLIK